MSAFPEDLDARCRPQVVGRQVSADGARKYVLRLHDGALVETVGIPHGDPGAPGRLTVCFSSQSGCAMGCAFCATGRRGLVRSLAAAEMAWQVDLVSRDFGCHADSAIAMGQGEPAANIDALMDAIRLMCRPEGLGIEPSELAVSTCGIPSGIRALIDFDVPVMLAVSLHAARQELRDALMPGVRPFPLGILRDELVRYNRATGRRVVVQYLMLEDVNDGPDDLKALEGFCIGLDALISLLRFNLVEGIPFAPSAFGKAALWSLELNERGIPTDINRPRGADIQAACGQLVGYRRARKVAEKPGQSPELL